MRAKSWILATSAAAGVLLAGAFAVAQDRPGPPADGPRAEFRERFQQMREHRMAELRTLLQLRPDQEAAFAAFQAAMTPPAMPHHDMDRPQGGLTTPQMLDLLAKHEADMKARMDRMSSAVLTFYAALSPEQQKAFDLIVARRHMHGFGMGMGGHDMEGHHMDGHGMDGHHRMGPPPGGQPPPPPAG